MGSLLDSLHLTTDEEADLIERALCQRSLIDFVRAAWDTVEPGTPMKEGRHIEIICQHLEAVANKNLPKQIRKQLRKTLINVPPGCMKSLLVSVFWPCWVWTTRPETRWMFASYEQPISTELSLKRRRILDSDWYKKHWGRVVVLTSDQDEKKSYENNRRGVMYSTSVGGGGTGKHPDFLVIDDPHNVKQSLSDSLREVAITWYKGTVSPRGKVRRVNEIIVMQRLHEDDLSGYWLSTQSLHQGTHICFPMRFESGRMPTTATGLCDWRTEEGELLWPEVLDEEAVAEMEQALTAVHAPGQLQQRPSTAGGTFFKRPMFRYFTRETYDDWLRNAGIPENERPKIPPYAAPTQREVFTLTRGDGSKKYVFGWDCEWFQTCDTATSLSEDAAYTVVMTFCSAPDGELLVYEVARDRLEIPQQFGYLMQHRQRYPQLEFQAIEKASSGIGIIQMGLQKGVPFMPLEPAELGSKERRAVVALTLYQSGLIYHLADAPWLSDFESEVLTFPGSKTKDQVDTLSYGSILSVNRAVGMPRILGDVDGTDPMPTLADYGLDPTQYGVD